MIVVGQDIAALTRKGDIIQISIGLIATIRALAVRRPRKPRRRARPA